MSDSVKNISRAIGRDCPPRIPNEWLLADYRGGEVRMLGLEALEELIRARHKKGNGYSVQRKQNGVFGEPQEPQSQGHSM